MKWFNWSSNKTRPKIIPKVGETWTLQKARGDPFPSRRTLSVTVLEIRNNWVRYSMSTLFPDERLRMSTFTSIYRRNT